MAETRGKIPCGAGARAGLQAAFPAVPHANAVAVRFFCLGPGVRVERVRTPVWLSGESISLCAAEASTVWREN